MDHITATKYAIKRHDETTPFAPENGNPLRFSEGDRVIYTNDYGAEFESTVTGIYERHIDDGLYASGHRYMLDKDSYWMPVKEANLRFAA